MTKTPTHGKPRPKPAYHHGDLRQALIDATRQLVVERGAESFSLADACRLAGVTTAAPYKHFRDKNEILAAIVEQGFDQLSERTMAAVEAAGAGTVTGIMAMGRAYVSFAADETAVFRLMFGQNPALKKEKAVEDTGRACFSKVIDQVAIYCARHGLEHDARLIAVELWTFVHGVSCLLIDGDYDDVAPGLDIDHLIAQATPKMLGVKPRSRQR
ncbi:MAG: TetR/AcrR family transcriptional regulator [Proteobacteria bacterium]|nr:TetR/AcrR family transcriptional regulator [Pseudomonadota bacterium]